MITPTKIDPVSIGAALLLQAAGSATAVGQAILFVDASAPNGGNGTSWTEAYRDLQDALDKARSAPAYREIWVAHGTYRPDRGSADREATFHLVNEVALYGGFAGHEADRDLRDPVANETILSGEIGNPSSDSDNSFRVVTASGTGATTLLDGFTVAHGRATVETDFAYGAGVYNVGGSPTVRGCRFENNKALPPDDGGGGAMYNEDGHPTIERCTFQRNTARRRGGAIYNVRSSPILRDCSFEHNTSGRGRLAQQGGGAVYTFQGNPRFERCSFLQNNGSDAGAIHNNESDAIVSECVFRGQTAQHGIAIYNYRCDPYIVRCEFTDNSVDFSEWDFGTAGGIFNRESGPTIVGCLFARNAAANGGALYNLDSAPRVVNCTFTDNVAGSGASIHSLRSSCVVINSILWNPGDAEEVFDDGDSATAITFSNARQLHVGQGNTRADPAFLDAPQGDYRLSPGSPCIDGADAGALPETVDADLDGLARFHDDQGTPDTGIGSLTDLDLGAYEFAGRSSMYLVVKPMPGVAGEDNLLQAGGATPGARSVFFYSRQGGSTPIPDCPGVSLSLDDPVRVGQATADAEGRATLESRAPGRWSGRSFFLQAFEPDTCRTTEALHCVLP